MVIKVRSYTDRVKKYRVKIDVANRYMYCPCKFWRKYGILNNEPCKHMIDAATAFIIANEYGIKLNSKLKGDKLQWQKKPKKRK